MFGKHIKTVLLAVTVPMFAISSLGNGSDGTIMRIRMETTVFSVEEPVSFFLEFENQGDTVQTVDLGGNGMGNCKISLTGGGETQICQATVKGGVSPIQQVALKPGEIVRRGMFLEDFTGSRLTPSEYNMTVEVMERPWQQALLPENGGQWAHPAPARTEFKVSETTEKLLAEMEKRFVRWAEIARGNEKSDWNSEQARKAVELSRHPDAMELQESWLESGTWETTAELGLLAESLLDSGDAKALEKLLEILLEKQEAGKSGREVLLSVLKKRGALAWKDERANTISPWADEIRNFVPVCISD